MPDKNKVAHGAIHCIVAKDLVLSGSTCFCRENYCVLLFQPMAFSGAGGV